jgi:hypothetical protein
MFRLLFWLVVIGVLYVVVSGIVPVPGVPTEEIVYSTPPPVASCGSSGCIAVYTLEVANTGRSSQDGVRVRLRSDALASPVVAPSVRRASEAVAVSAGSDRAGIEMYPLGQIGPEEHVALVFALRAASRETVPQWDRVLVGVDPTAGAARQGDVVALSAGRIVNAAGRMTERVVSAVRKAIASS